MKDYFGSKLLLNDEVAFIETNYRNYLTGNIIKFTPKKLLIQYNCNKFKRSSETYRFGSEVIKK